MGIQCLYKAFNFLSGRFQGCSGHARQPTRRTKIHKISLMTRCREKTEQFKFKIVFICYLVSVVFRVVSTESILPIVLGLYIKGRYVCLETISNSERTDSLRSCGLPIQCGKCSFSLILGNSMNSLGGRSCFWCCALSMRQEAEWNILITDWDPGIQCFSVEPVFMAESRGW